MSKQKILVIDNEPHWIDFIKHNLTVFEVTVVPNIEAALTELKTNQFDLIMVGSPQLKDLKAIEEKYADIPFVVTTIQRTSRETRDAYRLGAKRYFTKSFNQADILTQIEGVIPLPPRPQLEFAQ